MIDLVLLVGKIGLLALLYLFLIAAARAGLGLVTDQVTRKSASLSLRVHQGPRELLGLTLPLTSPIVIGRSEGSDVVIADDFVSARHARITPTGPRSAVLEDLNSTNGTAFNGELIQAPVVLQAGDRIQIGDVHLVVEAL